MTKVLNSVIIPGGNINARQAAQEFVDANFPDRKIGRWDKNCFRLLDGCRWWEVKLCKQGWEITPLEVVAGIFKE